MIEVYKWSYHFYDQKTSKFILLPTLLLLPTVNALLPTVDALLPTLMLLLTVYGEIIRAGDGHPNISSYSLCEPLIIVR